MILTATPYPMPPSVTATVQVEHHAAFSAVYETAPVEETAFSFGMDAPEGDLVSSQAKAAEVPEEYDWTQPKILRQYIRLEQKVLAGKASPEETQRYKSMKADRNSKVFADRYVNDYAEIQRLKVLSEKLAEIQQYLRPIRMG